MSLDHPDGSADGPALVELRVPAEASFVTVLRTLTSSLAARCDLTIDEVEDLRIAVDEAGTLLLPHAGPDGMLSAVFGLRPHRLEVRVGVGAGTGAELDRDGFAWVVLRALADTLQVTSDDGRLSIELSKQRAAHPQ